MYFFPDEYYNSKRGVSATCIHYKRNWWKINIIHTHIFIVIIITAWLCAGPKSPWQWNNCEGGASVPYPFTFTFMHLADAFIQSDLQCIQAIHFFYQYVFSLGIEPTIFCAANAMLYHWATGTLNSYPRRILEPWIVEGHGLPCKQSVFYYIFF